MESKILFLDPLCCRPRFKCGTEGLIVASILGATGLMSGFLGSASASSNNRAALAFNKWSQLQAQDYNTKMYERQLEDQESMYNKYQSPQAIAKQLQEAGINPSALAGGHGFSGGSMSSVPSAGSSPALSAPALENAGVPIGNAIEQMSRVINNMADNDLKRQQVTKVLSEIKGQELANAHADFDNYLLSKYGENEKINQLRDLLSSAMLKEARKDYTGAQKDYQKVLEKIANKELGIKDEEYSQLVYRGTRLAQIYDDEHELRVEEKKVKKSQQSSNYASAEQSRASSNLLRAQKAGQEFTNIMLQLDSESAQQAAQSKFNALEASLRKHTWEDNRDRAKAEVELRKLRERIIHYEKYSNAASFDDFWDNFPIIGGIVRGLAK